jgi:L-ascorbate metabolism protein UlaG (beta-lactamase superfamily)
MNLPFTMNWINATNMIRAIRPRVVYPYHYRDSGTTYTNPPLFKQMLGTDPGVEVRLRNWY